MYINIKSKDSHVNFRFRSSSLRGGFKGAVASKARWLQMRGGFKGAVASKARWLAWFYSVSVVASRARWLQKRGGFLLQRATTDLVDLYISIYIFHRILHVLVIVFMCVILIFVFTSTCHSYKSSICYPIFTWFWVFFTSEHKNKSNKYCPLL